MVHEMIKGTFRQTNLPNESAEYLSKREELLGRNRVDASG